VIRFRRANAARECSYLYGGERLAHELLNTVSACAIKADRALSNLTVGYDGKSVVDRKICGA